MTTRPPDPYGGASDPSGYGLPPPVYPGYPQGYPGPGPYPYDPYGSFPPSRPPGTNGKAIVSLVLSVIGMTCCGLTAIVGLILGIVAMRETRATGQDGYGVALAGTIVGGLAIAGWVIYALIYVALLASGWQWI